MKKILIVATFLMTMVLAGSLAFGNPASLPKHPGYPMGEFKDPVSGMATANDPGQQAPSQEEALRAAAAFDDPRVINTAKENRPNVVHDFMEKDRALAPKGDKS